MLPKKRRLSRSLMVGLKRSRPTFFSTPHLRLSLYGHAGRSLFSVSVAKKVVKGAVDRNRIRRKIYVAIGRLSLRLKDGFIAILSASITQNDFFESAELESEITELFLRAKII